MMQQISLFQKNNVLVNPRQPLIIGAKMIKFATPERQNSEDGMDRNRSRSKSIGVRFSEKVFRSPNARSGSRAPTPGRIDYDKSTADTSTKGSYKLPAIKFKGYEPKRAFEDSQKRRKSPFNSPQGNSDKIHVLLSD